MSRFFAPARLTIVASVWLLLVGPLFGMTNGDRLDEKARCEPAELDATGTTLPSPYYFYSVTFWKARLDVFRATFCGASS
jgi:hypothetical protein